MTHDSTHDVAIIGAGPVGLCLARALGQQGLRVALVERQAEAALAEPAFDGREIAMTHGSIRLLRELGVLAHIPVDQVFPLRAARVHAEGDHRIAMAASVLALVADGPSRIDDADNVATSYPGFLAAMTSLGADLRAEP